MKGKITSILSAGIMALSLSGAALAAKIDINSASAETLAAELVGVGPVIAERIVKWRQENGPFESVDELLEVSGVGAKTLENNRENLSIEASSE